MKNPDEGAPQPFVMSDEKVEYYRARANGCTGAPSCVGWSCIPLVELIGVIDALRSQLASQAVSDADPSDDEIAFAKVKYGFTAADDPHNAMRAALTNFVRERREAAVRSREAKPCVVRGGMCKGKGRHA